MKNYISKNQILEQKEIDELKKEINKSILLVLSFCLLIGLIFHMIIYLNYGKINYKAEIFYALIIAIVIFIRQYFTRKIRKDISNSIKELVDLTIIDKISYEDKEPGLGGEFINYKIITDFGTYSVNKELYDKTEIKGIIILHRLPITKRQLKIDL